MAKRLTAAKYAIHLIRRLYEATDGKPMAWRMMAVAGSDNAAPGARHQARLDCLGAGTASA